MFAPIHLTYPADVADALREAQLRLHTLRNHLLAPATIRDISRVEEYLAKLEEAVLEHDWTPDPDVDDEAVS